MKRLLVVLALLPLGACATKRDLRDLQAEIRAQQVRQDSVYVAIQRLILSVRDSVALYSDDVFNFRGDVNNRMALIEEQLLRIGELTGQSQRSLASLRDQMETQRQIDLRRQEQAAVDPTGEANDANDPAQEEGFAGLEETPEDIFNVAMESFNRGSFTVARMGFQGFLDRFPGHPLSTKAHLKLGELLVQEGDLDAAAEEYLKVQQAFPDSEDVPDALYRSGALYLEMENFSLAEQYLQQVVNSYPDHPVAQLARDRLADIP